MICKEMSVKSSDQEENKGGCMRYISCANCKNILKFVVPENKENKFWYRCCSCGAVNDLALDAAASGESRPKFRVIGVRN
jgi:hypothetical protein